MKQEFTSKDTSINKDRLPSIYHLDLHDMTILDYGCGKYTEKMLEYAKEHNCKWFGYDKYNQDENVNKTALNVIADVVVCANVLNVIKEDEIIFEVVRDCLNHTKTVAYFSVYEKDGSNQGQETKTDCYQRNQKKKEYIELLNNNGFNAELIKGGYIKVAR